MLELGGNGFGTVQREFQGVVSDSQTATRCLGRADLSTASLA